ncbi:MAG: hemerythrin domain-containing protein [Catenulispora sp.]|nr:hemerythrin domain-containing protein [Catenulispora sp.]
MSTDQQDVVKMLIEQHTLVKKTFTKVLGTTGETKKQLFEELADLIHLHELSEQQVIHPLTRTAEQGEQIVAERLLEEAEADRTIAELRKLSADDPTFQGRLEGLQQAVVAHAEREEGEEFPLLMALSADQRAALADELRNAQAGV